MSKRILFVTPIPTHPQNAGHRSRIFHLTRALRDRGFDVHIAYLEGYHQGIDADLCQMEDFWGDSLHVLTFTEAANSTLRGVDKQSRSTWNVDDWFDDRVEGEFKDLYQYLKPSVVVSEYITLSKTLTYCSSKSVKIIDCMDVFTDRSVRMKSKGVPSGNWYSFSEYQELLALKRADILLTSSHHDATHFSSLLPTPMYEIGHLLEPQESCYHEKSIPDLGIMASGGESNVYYTQQFIETTFSKIRKQIPECRLVIAGKVSSKLSNLPCHCILMGEVDHPKVFFDKVTCVVNPETFGTGMSVKNLTALAHGMPLVTTPIGARGIESGEGNGFLVARSVGELVETLVRVLSSRHERLKLTSSAKNFYKQYYDKQCDSLKELITIHF